MISPHFFVESLAAMQIDFYTGVPDSLLKQICAYITEKLPVENNVIAANEGGAVGLAAGYYLATNKVPVVYMQNSGEGNSVNPLMSLTDKEVYNIPILLVIGWRGEPGVKDEPQHLKQGKVTLALLETMDIKYEILSKDEEVCLLQLKRAKDYMTQTNEPYALVVRKDTFSEYLPQGRDTLSFPMVREEAISILASHIEDAAAVVSTTGMISRELFEYREGQGQGHERDFLTVGAMGHASQIALGIAMQKKDRRVYCFDGDGASLMHLGSMAIIASINPKNYVHIVFNNGAHDSVGGQPTVGLEVNLPQIAQACGYNVVLSVADKESLCKILGEIRNVCGSVFLEVKVKKGARKDLGRPTTTPIQNKEAFMNFLSKKSL